MLSYQNGNKLRGKKLENSQLFENLVDCRVLNNPWVKEEIRKDIRKYLKIIDYESMTYQNLWYIANIVLKRKIHSLKFIYHKRRQAESQPSSSPEAGKE